MWFNEYNNKNTSADKLGAFTGAMYGRPGELQLIQMRELCAKDTDSLSIYTMIQCLRIEDVSSYTSEESTIRWTFELEYLLLILTFRLRGMDMVEQCVIEPWNPGTNMVL